MDFSNLLSFCFMKRAITAFSNQGLEQHLLDVQPFCTRRHRKERFRNKIHPNIPKPTNSFLTFPNSDPFHLRRPK